MKSKIPRNLAVKTSVKLLTRYFSVDNIDELGEFSEGEVVAAGMLLQYVEFTQIGMCRYM